MPWIKSSLSVGNLDCVELAPRPNVIAVRDSKDPDGPRLAFDRDAWRAFVADLRMGRLAP